MLRILKKIEILHLIIHFGHMIHLKMMKMVIVNQYLVLNMQINKWYLIQLVKKF